MSRELHFPTLYQTAPHPCPYLPENTAVNLIIDPNFEVDIPLYERLLEHGFRRNGGLYYRPFCNHCSQCRSVRIDVNGFTPNRAQKRCMSRNSDVSVSIHETRFTEEQFDLYLRYQSGRHRGDSMDDPDPEKFRRFLIDSKVSSYTLEIRLENQLTCAAIVDRVAGGLSAVYTFFDPDQERRSLGTFAILSQLDLARRLKLNWVYLGYWINDCRKMSYKVNFQPLQQFDTHTSRWVFLDKTATLDEAYPSA